MAPTEKKRHLLQQTSLPLELREDGAAKKIVGYASVFNQTYDLGWYGEEIMPGAFSRTLREHPDVRALFDHDTGKPIGRTVNQTLSLREDTKGLYAEITPPDTTIGRDALENVRSGLVTGMSFGFNIVTAQWARKDGKDILQISDVDLWEVSVVTFPAYEGTSAATRHLHRSLQNEYAEPKELWDELQAKILERAKRGRELREKRIAMMSKVA